MWPGFAGVDPKLLRVCTNGEDGYISVDALSPRETSGCDRPVSGGGCSEVARRAFVPGSKTGVWLVAPLPGAGGATAMKRQDLSSTGPRWPFLEMRP